MVRPLEQHDLQPKDIRNLRQLPERGVRPAVLEVRQPAQGDAGQLGKVALSQTQQLPPGPDLLTDLFVRHRFLRRIIVRFSGGFGESIQLFSGISASRCAF
jgi:hypothetical protein